MPAAAETYSLGAPVEIGKIEQELKKLWRESEGALTRASLMNFAVYSEEPGSLQSNTQLMAKITENHACRGIVIEADCRSEENRPRWDRHYKSQADGLDRLECRQAWASRLCPHHRRETAMIGTT